MDFTLLTSKSEQEDYYHKLLNCFCKSAWKEKAQSTDSIPCQHIILTSFQQNILLKK